MSDAKTAARRTESDPLQLSKDFYLAVCRAKGAPRQEDRAELLGIPRRSLVRYETNATEPHMKVMRHIAATLGVRVTELWPAA